MKKKGSGEAYDVNKRRQCSAKSTNESRASYFPEPAWIVWPKRTEVKVLIRVQRQLPSYDRGLAAKLPEAEVIFHFESYSLAKTPKQSICN